MTWEEFRELYPETVGKLENHFQVGKYAYPTCDGCERDSKIQIAQRFLDMRDERKPSSDLIARYLEEMVDVGKSHSSEELKEILRGLRFALNESLQAELGDEWMNDTQYDALYLEAACIIDKVQGQVRKGSSKRPPSKFSQHKKMVERMHRTQLDRKYSTGDWNNNWN